MHIVELNSIADVIKTYNDLTIFPQQHSKYQKINCSIIWFE